MRSIRYSTLDKKHIFELINHSSLSLSKPPQKINEANPSSNLSTNVHLTPNQNSVKQPQQQYFSIMKKKLLNQSRLDQYFNNFQNLLNKNQKNIAITSEKKGSELQRGLYILIQGKILYTWSKTNDKRQYLYNMAKSNLLFYYTDPCMQNKNINDINLLNHQSFIIQQQFSIIQCQFQNCYILQDSILIKISEQQRQFTEFNKNYYKRCNIIDKCFIHNQINGNDNDRKLFRVNMKIHSSFRMYKYCFRNVIRLAHIAIVDQGIVKQQKKNYDKSTQYFDFVQLSKYSVLLPGVSYEVVSTQVQILVIQRNPSLNYTHKSLIQAYKTLKNLNNKSNHQLKNIRNQSMNLIVPLQFNTRKKQNFCSLHYSIQKQVNNITKDLKKWQINKRKKNLINISKKYRNQLIITMQTCKQSLSFSQKQTQRLKLSQSNVSIHKNIGKKPKILFDYSKYCTNKSMRSLNSIFNQNKTEQITNLSNKQNHYRYKQTSKNVDTKRLRERKTYNQRNKNTQQQNQGLFIKKYKNSVSSHLYKRFKQFQKQELIAESANNTLVIKNQTNQQICKYKQQRYFKNLANANHQ